jgi:long-chain acyl-CoA synthetase
VALLALDAEAQHRCDDVRAAIEAAVELANSALSRVEQLKRFAIVGADWQPGGDELTPTSKLKRRSIHEKYRDLIEDLYR